MGVGSEMETATVTATPPARDPYADLAPDDPTRELLYDYVPGTDQSVVIHSRYADIARRLILTPNLRRVSEETGYTLRGMNYVVAHPDFQAIYRTVYQAIYGNIDETLANEKLDVYRRTQSLNVRAVTLLSEIMGAVRKHIADAPVPSAAKLKAGVDAVAQARMFQETAIAAQARQPVGTVNIRADKVDIIRAAIAESGVDLSDVIEGVVVEDKPAAS